MRLLIEEVESCHKCPCFILDYDEEFREEYPRCTKLDPIYEDAFEEFYHHSLFDVEELIFLDCPLPKVDQGPEKQGRPFEQEE